MAPSAIGSDRRSLSLPARIKSLNYLNNILAKIEANNAGCEEAIMLKKRLLDYGTVAAIMLLRITIGVGLAVLMLGLMVLLCAVVMLETVGTVITEIGKRLYPAHGALRCKMKRLTTKMYEQPGTLGERDSPTLYGSLGPTTTGKSKEREIKASGPNGSKKLISNKPVGGDASIGAQQ